MLCLFLFPLLLAFSTIIRYNRIMKGGIWYFSNEAFFFRGLKEKNLLAQYYISFDLLTKFLIVIFLVSIKEYTFVSVVVAGFFCIAHAAVLFII